MTMTAPTSMPWTPEASAALDAMLAAQEARRTIVVRDELNAVAAEAEAALLADPEAGIFVRARRLVRVVRDEGAPRSGLHRPAGSPVIEGMSLDALRGRLDRAARWVRNAGKGFRAILPPEWAARAVQAADEWRFPVLAGVIEAPTLRPDGGVLDRPGYDAATGLLFMPTGDFPPVPVRPSAAQVQAAVDLLRGPFADFPFIAESDRAAAVAAVLSLVARHAIEGCVPAFAWRATAPGTGKGLGCDVVARIGTGRSAARMVLPSEDDELRKALLAVAFEGTPVVLLDNVDRALGSVALAAALTSETVTGRLLGSTAMLCAPLRAMWMVTGNGLTFKGDLGRRIVPVDLDAHVEHPEDRSGFRHPDLLGWVREHRGELVAGALTILRGYHIAGRPAHGAPRMGSFEAWDDLVRGATVWAGFDDPVAGRERIRREDDGDLLSLRAALSAWREAFGKTSTTAAEAVAVALRRAGRDDDAVRDPSLRDALLALTPNKDKLDARPLGYALRRVKGRICGGAYFKTAGEEHSTTRWTVADAVQGEMGEMGDMFPPNAGANKTERKEEQPETSPPSAASPPPSEGGDA